VIAVPGGNYREYLIGGVLVQTIAFGMIGPATALATDLTEGVVDRFRSLPIAPSSFLLGHMLAALLATALGIVVLSLGGLLVGWHIHASTAQAAAAMGCCSCSRSRCSGSAPSSGSACARPTL
jgi:ABC-2 type transport system permease protein